jgi:phosphate acetyltransferase
MPIRSESAANAADGTVARPMLENHPIDEIRIGDGASLQRTLTRQDIQLFATISGDVNPAHLDEEYAKATRFHEIIGHGMWGASLISAVLGTQYPGPGTIYVGQDLRFLKPVHVGDTVTVTVTVTEVDPVKRRVLLDCRCTDQTGADVIQGRAEVIAPKDKITREAPTLPDVLIADKNVRYAQLVAAARGFAPIPVAVVHPCERDALAGALAAAQAGLIVPRFVGPASVIRALATELGADLSPWQVDDAPDARAAAVAAVALARAGAVEALLQGSGRAEDLLAEVASPHTGIRTARCLSHVNLLDVPRYAKPLMLTDGRINALPDLMTKADIVRNAIDVARSVGVAMPRVAILAAVDTVSSTLRSTLDAAALCKMAERGQITGAVIDGPLAFDDAVTDEHAVRTVGALDVAGHADILVAPDLESGSMLAHQLESLADAQAAGIVMGARVPVLLTRRGDTPRHYVAAAAMAVLVRAYARRAEQRPHD